MKKESRRTAKKPQAESKDGQSPNENQFDEGLSLVARYIALVNESSEGNSCIFRGQADFNWPLRASGERRIIESLGELEPSALRCSLVEYEEKLIAEARQKGFGIEDGRVVSDLELLAKLQHFGAATGLLDFTESALVALYFACSEFTDQDGAVFLLAHNVLKSAPMEAEIRTLHIGNQNLDMNKDFSSVPIWQWKPLLHGPAERRFSAQKGVLALNMYYERNYMKKIKILATQKKVILKTLRENFLISSDTLFEDLLGFAQNNGPRQPHSAAAVEFFLGIQKLREGCLVEAERHLNNAVRLDPWNSSARFNRGLIKLDMDRPEEALEEFSELISMNPDDADAYFFQGKAHFMLDSYREALDAFNRSISLGSNLNEVFRWRGCAYARLKMFKQALDDFNRYIESEDPDAEAFELRGVQILSFENLVMQLPIMPRLLNLAVS